MQKEDIENLYIFNAPELQVFDFDELRTRVFGYAFVSPILNENPLFTANIPEDNGYLKLFCGHADMSSPISRYAPISLAELSRFGFAYSALGHIHNREEKEDSAGRIRYCGFAEGRSFDELGEGGVFVVDVDEDSCEARRIVLSSRAFFAAEVMIPADAEGVVARICNAIKSKQYPSGAHLRLTFTGTADAQTVKEIKNSQNAICSATGLEYIEIEDTTLPIYDGKYLEKDVTVRGEIYRTLLPKLTSTDSAERKRAVLALKIALAAIDGNSVFDVVN